MKKLLFISGLCVFFAVGVHAQDKGNKSVSDTKDGRIDGRITVVSLDSIVNLDTMSLENYPKSIPIPNVLDGRSMAVKDISVPMSIKMLNGQGSVMMPGTELLDNSTIREVGEHFRQFTPLRPDSLKTIPKILKDK